VQTANIGFTDGDNAMVIADGGAVTFPIASVFTSGFQSNGAINVGVDDTGYDVKFFGDTASAFMLWDASADDLILGGAAGLSVNSAALVTGVLTTTAATVFNGGFASNAISTINTSSSGVQPLLTLSQADNTSGNTWGFDFKRTTNTGAGDLVAKIHAAREGGDATGIAFSINKANGTLIEAGRFDSSGNWLVGRTSTTDSNVGGMIRLDGFVQSTRDGNIAADFNRKSSDGDIVRFSKDSSSVGSIGSVSGALYIGSPNGSDAFAKFNNNSITPSTSAGAVRDNAIDLGATTAQFKNLYLSGHALAKGAVVQRENVSLTSTTQLTRSGALAELSTSLRIAFTPKHASSVLYAEVSAWFCNPNNNGLIYGQIYDVTNDVVASLPPSDGNRLRVHFATRTTKFDVNDFDMMTFMIPIAAANTTERTYTIFVGTESQVLQFLSSTLSTTSGVNSPVTFSITEIYNP